MKEYHLEGSRITDLQSFLKEFGEMVNGAGGYFGTDLFQFDDCLFGYGGLEYPCEIIWTNHDVSKITLNKEMLIHWYTKMLKSFEADFENNKDDIFVIDMMDYYRGRIKDANNNEYTLFDEIVSIIESVPKRNKHCQIKLTLK